jgi:hypothetical protein
MDRGDLSVLQRTLASAWKELNPVPDPWYALFSRAGVTPDLLELASQWSSRVLVFALDDLFDV